LKRVSPPAAAVGFFGIQQGDHPPKHAAEKREARQHFEKATTAMSRASTTVRTPSRRTGIAADADPT
jgi:hypothetical protein